MRFTINKYFIVLLFFLLLEYQVFINPGEHSPLTSLGLIFLSLYHTFTTSKEFKYKNERKPHFIKLVRGSYIILTLYILALISTLFVFDDFGDRFIAVLSVTCVSMIILSVFERRIKGKIANLDTDKKKCLPNGLCLGRGDCDQALLHPNKMNSFTIPILFLYLFNFLLSVQIETNLAYQFILVLSTVILYDRLSKQEQLTEQLEKGKITDHELRHHLFHHWIKYLNYFLGLWYFVSLEANGIIDGSQRLFLIYIFTIIYFTLTCRLVTHFTYKCFIFLNIFALLAAAAPYLMNFTFRKDLPLYIQILTMYLFYDLEDMFIHSRKFKEVTTQLWQQKMLIFIMVTIFITQLNEMEKNPKMEMDLIFTSVLGNGAQGTIDVNDNNSSSISR